VGKGNCYRESGSKEQESDMKATRREKTKKSIMNSLDTSLYRKWRTTRREKDHSKRTQKTDRTASN